MSDTHRFGAIVCVCIVGIALTLSFVVRAHTELSLGTTEPEFVATVPGRPGPEAYAVLPQAGQVQGATTSVVSTSPIEEKSAYAEVAGSQEMSPALAVRPLSIDALTLQGAVPTRANATELADTAAFRAALARRIHELTNRERAKHDLPALAYEDVLAQNAGRYSARMQAENFLDHVDPDGCNMTCRFAADDYVAQYWGENLARWRSSYAPSLDELAIFFVREWVKSSGHRDNLLSPNFTHEGIGIAIDGNEVFATVHFAEPI